MGRLTPTTLLVVSISASITASGVRDKGSNNCEAGSDLSASVFHEGALSYRHLTSDEELPPAWSGKYREDKEIGSGADGRVFRAYAQDRSEEPLAIKEVVVESGWAADQSVQGEIKSMEYLTKMDPTSEHFVPLLDHTRVVNGGQTTYYLAMPLMDSDLESVRRHGQITEHDFLMMASDIVRSVKFMHEAGWAHRDLKPDNIMVTSRGRRRALLGDFGRVQDLNNIRLSKRTGKPILSVVGTPYFMSPTLLCNQKPRPNEDDVWALGVVLAWWCGRANTPCGEVLFGYESDLCKCLDSEWSGSATSWPMANFDHFRMEGFRTETMNVFCEEALSTVFAKKDTFTDPKVLDRLLLVANKSLHKLAASSTLRD